MTTNQARNAILENLYDQGYDVETLAECFRLSKMSVIMRLVRMGVYDKTILEEIPEEEFGR